MVKLNISRKIHSLLKKNKKMKIYFSYFKVLLIIIAFFIILLNFIFKIEYSALANQRITYAYEIEIRNDRRIEIKKDGIESIVDFDDAIDLNTSIFRNLQDSISVIDRSDYSWEKMGKAQMRGMMTQLFQQYSQEINTNNTQPHDEHTY